MLKRLAQIAPVHVGCFADDDRDMGFAAEMSAITASQWVLMRDRSRLVAGLTGLVRGQPLLVSLFDHPGLHHWVTKMLAERPISAVVAYSAQMAHFVPALPPYIPFLMDFVDFDSAKYAAYGAQGRGPMGWINRREGRVLLDFERAVADRAQVSVFVSEAEAALFRAASGQGADKVRALENGVALDYFDPAADFARVEEGAGPLFVFTGQMDYRPNVEAVDYFARRTLPVIRAVHPDARFAIVGRAPSKPALALGGLPGVIVTGAVPDVRGWLAAADVVVAPLRIARGVQNKILEAMAMARPVVASAQAAEGIDARDGVHFLIAEDSDQEAARICDLLAAPERAAKLGAAARARMVERYDWDATLASLPDLLRVSGAALSAAA
jgi:sugar transferase (PEP-CTERM/EpsH1 system associated)